MYRQIIDTNKYKIKKSLTKNDTIRVSTYVNINKIRRKKITQFVILKIRKQKNYHRHTFYVYI